MYRSKFSFLLLILLLTLFGSACKKQVQELPTPNITKTTLAKPEKKHHYDGPHNFYEYHHDIRTRTGDAVPRYSTNYKQVAYQKALQDKPRKVKARNSNLNWQERGPGNVGGRTRAVLVDKRDTTNLTWLVGSAGGGIWKTNDGGLNWRMTTEELSNMATTTLAASPLYPDIIYAGTGEGYGSFSMIQGEGIYKSIDGGENWSILPATSNQQFENVLRLIVDPNDPNIILAATRRSFRLVRDSSNMPRVIGLVMKSTDGGESWKTVLGDPSKRTITSVQQIIADPKNFNVLYASVNSAGIVKSTNKGETWFTIFNAEEEEFGRMEMAISPVDPQVIYFASETDNTANLLKSRNGGRTWNAITGSYNNWLANQGWYDNAIAAHPYDANTVLVGGAGSLLSITTKEQSNEASFEVITDGFGEYEESSKGVHVDHHNITLLPIDSATGAFYILNANDGGIAFSKDNGATFTQTGDTFKEEYADDGLVVYPTNIGYNTSQFYSVDKMNGADKYIGGTQDNGTWLSPTNSGITSIWRQTKGGDGFEAAWNYANSDLMLISSQFNGVSRSTDSGLTWDRISLPGEGPFFTRLETSKQDPDLVFAISDLGVLKSIDFGLTWSVISMPPEWKFARNPIAISLASPQVVWTGGRFNASEKMVVSTDGGFSFSATSGYDKASLGSITGIGTHPFNKNKAYALFSMANGPKILQTEDLGNSWTDISGFVSNREESTNGFPDVATYSLVVMPYDTNQIWVGTEIGLFESIDGGVSWHYADNGLPPVAIFEMKIVNDEVVIATHGRGIWSVSLPELAGYEPLATVLTPNVLFKENGFNGQIGGEVKLRSAYDSTILEITLPDLNGNAVIKRSVLAGNATPAVIPFDFQININTDSLVRAEIKLTSFVGTDSIYSKGYTMIYDVDEQPITKYFNNFDEKGQNDFVLSNFKIYKAPNFENKGLHSIHPYPDLGSGMFTVFQKPILIKETPTLFSFDEVVLVEPGRSTDSNSPMFYDFVRIEGTNDYGQTWVELDTYDSRKKASWESAFYQELSGTPKLIENHTLDLADFFSIEDTVYLRFSLVADQYIEGWGWMLDNINLQATTTAIQKLPEQVALKNFPNPFTNTTTLEYTLDKKSEVSATLYSIDGKQVGSLLQTTQPAGEYQYRIDTKILEVGVYFCRFQVNETEQTLKWIKK